LSIAQKQMAPTTQIIKTPIKTESMATPCAGAANARAHARSPAIPLRPDAWPAFYSDPGSGN
jgi:hypothetical protein